MTLKDYYRPGNHYTTFKTNHRKYSGKIYEYDFGGYKGMYHVAENIIKDTKFDKMCEINTKMKFKKKGDIDIE